MLVSVICTVKNGEQFIEETVESIRRQTLLDWEMLVVNDGSTDGTARLLAKLCEQDTRLRIIETTGVGRGRALNLAIEEAHGIYIANIDAGDLAHPERLVRQYMLLEKRKDIACLVSESGMLQGMGEVTWPDVGDAELTQITAETLFKGNPIDHSSLFIRKSTLQKIGGYDEARELLFDYELWLRLVTRGHLIYGTSEQLATKRLHVGQSYEKRKRFRYLMATRKLKRSFIQQTSPRFKYYLLANVGVLYGLLPQTLRYHIKKATIKI
ncbi:MAG: glycosyltransferase family A protein [Solibacillus sp.]